MKIIDYIRDTKGEMKHVSWPTRFQSVAFTVLVILISLLTAAYLGLFDFIFSEILKAII
ncbi:MAG TPA: preprotein translocase subunit SecE [Candidatus Paceibacterota bacterium]|jgi:preprotein translocase subunit SecE|nr:preprotein translocase subunit SecE [Candidatus Paceibacterota bacterium]HJN62846.1 preprotein translocase subunit SecE [Candidatus Paceibacterota bacterium]|tara:strand:- start:94 stop:270 length:177 start_codon:yes stop_codon:yes gene_type:complete